MCLVRICPVCNSAAFAFIGTTIKPMCMDCWRKQRAEQAADKPVDNHPEAEIQASNNVRFLPGSPMPENMPSQKVIDLLEKLLAQAKAGDMPSVAVAWFNGGRQVFTAWQSEGQHMALLGGVTWLQQRMAAEGDE